MSRRTLRRTSYAAMVALFAIVPSILAAQGRGGGPAIVSVVFNPPTVTGGQNATATITLSAPADSRGFDVALAITSNVATISSSAITIAAGQTSATVVVATQATSTLQLATLTATNRNDSKSGNLTVAPPQEAPPAPAPAAPAPAAPAPAAPPTASITGFSFSMPTRSGTNNFRRVTTDIPAPTNGLVVRYTASGPRMLGIYTEDTIAAGATSHSRQFTNGMTSTDQPFSVTASLNATTRTIQGTLLAPRLIGLTSPDSVKAGDTTPLWLRLTFDATSFDPFQVNITSNNPAVPSRGAVTIYGTSTGGVVSLTSTPVAVPTPVTITASHYDRTYSKTVTFLPLPSVLSAITATPNPGKSGQAVTVTASVNVAPYAAPVTVRFEVPTPPPGFTYPSTIVIPVGATSGSVTITPPRLVAPVTMTLTGTYEGVSKSVSVRIDP